jgi:hypothetical protein
MIDEVEQDIILAYIQRKANDFRLTMLEKGITTVVPTATEAYLAWKRPRRKHDPMLSPESTRIPDLRRVSVS